MVYLFHGGLVGIGKSQHNKCQKHDAKDYILLTSIEVTITIGGGPDHNCFLIIKVVPWSSMNFSFQGLPAPEAAMNAVKLACKANVRCAEQSKVAPVLFHP